MRMPVWATRARVSGLRPMFTTSRAPSRIFEAESMATTDISRIVDELPVLLLEHQVLAFRLDADGDRGVRCGALERRGERAQRERRQRQRAVERLSQLGGRLLVRRLAWGGWRFPSRRGVALARPDLHAFPADLHLDPAESSVALIVLRVVAEDVIGAVVGDDPLPGLAEIVAVYRRVAAGVLREAAQAASARAAVRPGTTAC